MSSSAIEEKLERASRRRRPLAGVQLMIVEDSRAISDAMRILALRSGARVRRADGVISAERHLKIFRPTVVVIDAGVPDGDGIDLARRVGTMMDPRPAILVVSKSGSEVAAKAAAAAAADGYLSAPIEDLATFEDAILAVIPEAAPVLRTVGEDAFRPQIAGSEAHLFDLENVQDLLSEALVSKDRKILRYAAEFLTGLAGTVEDWVLFDSATALARSSENDGDVLAAAGAALTLVNERLMLEKAATG